MTIHEATLARIVLDIANEIRAVMTDEERAACRELAGLVREVVGDAKRERTVSFP